MKQFFTNIAAFVAARPRLDWVFVGLLLAVYAGLAIWHLTVGSIWFDEAFSAYLLRFEFWEIALFTAADVHPPLYYWLLKLWTDLFGTTEAGLRSMSIFFGLIAATFAYLWTKRHFGRRAALAALLVLVLTPLFIRYGQEARMYTLAAALIMAATYVFSLAMSTGKRWQWVLYGVLVSLGMWTHYFTALAWIAHWVWRGVVLYRNRLRGKKLRTAFFSKNWIIAHVVAVGLFLPWLPAMVVQLLIIQTQGFWIGPIGLDTFGTYFGTLVLFLKSNQVTGWLAAGMIALLVLLIVSVRHTWPRLDKAEKQSYLLLASLAVVPPVLLLIASLPPLTPSFVERYLLPAAIATALFVGVSFSIGLRHTKVRLRIATWVILIGMLAIGIGNMYYYNNYNKNSGTGIETRQLVTTATERSEPGIPIIANSPWVYYEASFYSTDDHPVYFIEENVEYIYGSLEMLKQSDIGKIKDFDAFLLQHPEFWYIGYSEGPLTPPRDNLQEIDSFAITNKIDSKTVYRGALYRVTSN